MQGYHESVLLKEAIDALIPAPWGVERDAWYLDATLGDGGHTIEIIKRGGKVIGFDQDPQALKRVQIRFGDLGIIRDKFFLVRGNFRDINFLTRQIPIKSGQTELRSRKFKGVIFDLGVSRMQFETPQRGFSIQKLGPLDMRMDPDLKVRALDLVMVGGRKELYELFTNLGEEKYSKRLADALVSAREVDDGFGIQTTKDLADLVIKVIGRKKGMIHPATRVFQALRIAVNDELNALQEGLDKVINLTDKGGKIVVISFHSLEDRIVKKTFKKWEKEGRGHVLTKKPILPQDTEVNQNPKARSAKMRIFEKL